MNGRVLAIPALLTTTSQRPYLAEISLNAAAIESASPTSRCSGWADRPTAPEESSRLGGLLSIQVGTRTVIPSSELFGYGRPDAHRVAGNERDLVVFVK